MNGSRSPLSPPNPPGTGVPRLPVQRHENPMRRENATGTGRPRTSHRQYPIQRESARATTDRGPGQWQHPIQRENAPPSTNRSQGQRKHPMQRERARATKDRQGYRIWSRYLCWTGLGAKKPSSPGMTLKVQLWRSSIRMRSPCTNRSQGQLQHPMQRESARATMDRQGYRIWSRYFWLDGLGLQKPSSPDLFRGPSAAQAETMVPGTSPGMTLRVRLWRSSIQMRSPRTNHRPGQPQHPMQRETTKESRP